MPPSAKASVLVVGAGPSGLMAAIQLARRDVRVRIIDKLPERMQQSRALGIHARSLELLDNLGIVDSFLNDGLVVRHMRIYAERKLLADISFDDLDSPFPFVLTLPQSQTEEKLEQHLRTLGVAVERAVELTGISLAPDSAKVTLKMADGRVAEESYDWVVACDGGRSSVRHALNLPFDGSAGMDDIFLLADVQIAWPEELGDQEGSLFDSVDGILAIFKMRGPRYRIVATMPPCAVRGDEPPTLQEMQEIVSKRIAPNVILSDPTWLNAFRVRWRQLQQYRHGRVLLAGDSAHIHSPAGGQGMNTGMQDAANLAWKLALVVKNGAHERLLDSYQEERHAVAAAVLRSSEFLTRVNIMRHPIGRELRNRLAPILAAQEVVQDKMRRQLSQVGIAYRGSPIVFEHKRSLMSVATHTDKEPDKPGIREWFDFGHGPAAGDRAPDAHAVNAHNGQAVRLYEALRDPRHTLLLLAGEHAPDSVLQQLAPLAHAAEQTYGRLVQTILVCASETAPQCAPKIEGQLLLDPDYSVHHRYGAGSACAYLIRPDGYVGYRGQPPELTDLDQYFRTLLGTEN